MKWYYIVAIIIFIKVAINLSKYLQCKYHLNQYFQWMKNHSWDLVESKSKVISLIKGAGVSDKMVPFLEPAGYGKLISGQISVLSNFPSLRRDIAELTIGMFHDAIGVYRRRIFETFNPLYWIELIINLPKKILVYLGVNAESVSIKVLQVLWWLLGVSIAVLIAAYQKELSDKIKPFIQNIFRRIR